MKITNLLLTLSLICSFQAIGQTNVLEQADSAYFDYKDYDKALALYQQVHTNLDQKDEDFGYVTDKIARTLFNLESKSLEEFDADKSIEYSKKFIQLANEYPSFIHEGVLEKKYWMYKNLVVAYFEKDDLQEANKYREKLYSFYKKGELPEGLNQYYNFEFFKCEDKNIWGYEWFEELPKDRSSKSFSKIVYYIYDTNADGSDKDQLYRFHVLMFHKIDNSTKFDYVLTKRIETATEEAGGTLYSYTYTDPIDFEKLRNDIREVLKGNGKPDVIHKNKKH
jgi:hypothetical protein